MAGYLLYRKFNAPLTQHQASNALRNAGAQTYTGMNGREYANLGGGVTIPIPQEGLPLNFAQKFLIGIDRAVPGSWLSRLVLT